MAQIKEVIYITGSAEVKLSNSVACLRSRKIQAGKPTATRWIAVWETSGSRHHEAPWNLSDHHSTIILWGFKRALRWAPIMSRTPVPRAADVLFPVCRKINIQHAFHNPTLPSTAMSAIKPVFLFTIKTCWNQTTEIKFFYLQKMFVGYSFIIFESLNSTERFAIISGNGIYCFYCYRRC